MKSRVLLLQLLQNCFLVLPSPLESRGLGEGLGEGPGEGQGPEVGLAVAAAAACPSTSSSSEPDSSRAVWELYTHLCSSKRLSLSLSLSLSLTSRAHKVLAYWP